LQEIQGLQSRNVSLEGMMRGLLEERDSLVETLKGHLPVCQDSVAMTRSAQLLAFSHRLAQLLNFAVPAHLVSPSAEHSPGVESNQGAPPTGHRGKEATQVINAVIDR
jgi:hypothetical protein